MKTTKFIIASGIFFFVAFSGIAQEKKNTEKSKARAGSKMEAAPAPSKAKPASTNSSKVKKAEVSPAEASPKKSSPIKKDNSRMVITEEGVSSKKVNEKQKPKRAGGN